MSRPGYWFKEGREIPYVQMEDSHVKNTLRYLRKQLVSTPDTLPRKIEYYSDKIAELGDEAQRRGLLPAGDISMEVLLITIAEWEAEWNRRPINSYRARPLPVYNGRPVRISAVPPSATHIGTVDIGSVDERHSEYKRGRVKVERLILPELDIEVHVSSITGYAISEGFEMDIELNRRLDSDL